MRRRPKDLPVVPYVQGTKPKTKFDGLRNENKGEVGNKLEFHYIPDDIPKTTDWKEERKEKERWTSGLHRGKEGNHKLFKVIRYRAQERWMSNIIVICRAGNSKLKLHISLKNLIP